MTKDTNFQHPPGGHFAILAYDAANDRFQVVHVDASGLLQVDLAAAAVTLDINFASQDDDVSVTQTAADDLSVSVHGYDGLLWRKQPLVWGYTDRWTHVLSETKSGDGQYSSSTTAVPPGYIYVLQVAWIKNESGARGPSYFRPYNGSDYLPVAGLLAPAQNEIATLNGPIVLKPGDFLNLAQDSCLNGDAIMAGVWGYKMKIDM